MVNENANANHEDRSSEDFEDGNAEHVCGGPRLVGVPRSTGAARRPRRRWATSSPWRNGSSAQSRPRGRAA
jgi:hypothetical protein